MSLTDVEIRLLKNVVKDDSFVSIHLNSFYESTNEWLEYQGQKLNWYNGAYGSKSLLTASYKATSGLFVDAAHDYRNSRYERLKDKGPLPEGKYWIALLPNPKRIAKADKNSGEILANKDGGIERIPDIFVRADGSTIIYPGWGKTRARLFADKATNTFGRSNFYLHDSHKGYSHGCIEVEHAFFEKLIAERSTSLHKFSKIALHISYDQKNMSTYGGTRY